MLEIPESHTLAAQLSETITGKIIRQVQTNSSPHGFAFYFGDPALYPERLSGRRVDDAIACAGQVELRLEHMRLLLYDGINARYLSPEEPVPKKHQLLLEFEDGSRLVCTIQMYGGLSAFADGENDSPYYHMAIEKPNPLTDAFDKAYFDRLLGEAKPTLSAKALLATEQRIPGLGNGVLQDILFQARIHPKTKLSTMDDPQRERLFTSIKTVLREMTDRGGRDTEKDLFGNKGGYRSILSKNTLKFPCPVCGGPLVRQAYLGGNIYFCPACQPLVN